MSAKKVAPKKPISAKKPVVAKTVAKAAPAKKAVAKPVAKKAPVVKKAVVAKKAPVVKKAVVTKKAPVAKKVTTKAVAKKDVATKTVAKAPAKKSPIKTTVKTPAKKASVIKTAPVVKKEAVAKKVEVKPVAKKESEKKVTKKGNEKILGANKKATTKVEKAVKEEIVLDTPFTKLLPAGKKLIKNSFFIEIDEVDDRLNKKKVSAELKGFEKPTQVMRRKASLVEETTEELYERVIQELEEKNLTFYREAATQVCTKCCVNIVAAEFRVDKDLGYCDDCAELLGLGFTKEARKVEYQVSTMKRDSLDEEEAEEDEEKPPSLEELEDEDDLEEDED